MEFYHELPQTWTERFRVEFVSDVELTMRVPPNSTGYRLRLNLEKEESRAFVTLSSTKGDGQTLGTDSFVVGLDDLYLLRHAVQWRIFEIFIDASPREMPSQASTDV